MADHAHRNINDVGADAAHDPPGAETLSVKAGHEPDRFAVRSILYVPVIMVVMVVVGFVIVTITFNGLTEKPPVDPDKNPRGAADSKKDVNARFATISSTDPEARTNQPRLEYLKQTANNDQKDDPAFYRSKRPIEAVGATWELRPEDLRPENFIDPTRKTRILVEAGWQGDDTKVAHIPIAEAMDALLASKKLPTKPGAKPAPVTTDGKPKISNSGRGGPSQPANPASPPLAGGKKEDKPSNPHP